MAQAVSCLNLKPRHGLGSKAFHEGDLLEQMWKCYRIFPQYFSSTLSVTLRTD